MPKSYWTLSSWSKSVEFPLSEQFLRVHNHWGINSHLWYSGAGIRGFYITDRGCCRWRAIYLHLEAQLGCAVSPPLPHEQGSCKRTCHHLLSVQEVPLSLPSSRLVEPGERCPGWELVGMGSCCPICTWPLASYQASLYSFYVILSAWKWVLNSVVISE